MRFFGIDLHHNNMTVVMIDEDDSRTTQKIELNSFRFYGFLKSLTHSDFVAVEASSNTFWFYDLIKPLVAECFVINPSKLLQVFKTNKKNDKIDARKIANKLRFKIMVGCDEDEFPTVYVPSKKVQYIRSLFSTYQQLRKQRTMNKNRIYSLLVQNGYHIKKGDLWKDKTIETISKLDLSETVKFQIDIFFENISHLILQIVKTKKIIFFEGRIFEKEIDLLTGINGISIFIAIAIMCDIADINRFKTAKKISFLFTKCSYTGSFK